MNIQGCVPRFLKAHGSLILTILSGLGLVGTVVATANAAPKAKANLEAAADEKAEIAIDRIHEQHPEFSLSECCDEATRTNALALTFWEKVDIAAPFYLPVILLGLGTMGCMAGAHILDMKKQAAMTAAYALLEQSFGGYRGEIREKYGAEADREAYISSQEKIKRMQDTIKRLEKEKGVYTFAIATAPGLIFRAKMAQVENAFAHFNRNLSMRGSGTLKEMYEFLGLPSNCPLLISGAPDEDYGWNEYLNECNFDYGWVDFRMKEVTSKDGEIVYVIYFDIPPYRLDIEDEESLDIMDETYDRYDLARAAEAAKDGYFDAAMRVDVDPDHIVYAQNCF